MSAIQRPDAAVKHTAERAALDVEVESNAAISSNDNDNYAAAVERAAAEAAAAEPAAAHPTIQPITSTTTIGNAAGQTTTVDLGFIHGFLASLSVILVSEVGDKTFFIAAIMAMRHPRLVVFAGAIGALGLMTVLSGESTYRVWRSFCNFPSFS